MTARPIVPPYVLDKARLSPNVAAQVRDACSSTNYKQAFIMNNVEDFIHTETIRAGRKLRRVYDAQHSDQLNFRSHRLVRREEDGPTGDRSVNDAFDNAGRVFDFYFQEHQWKSLDNKFMPITSVVHFDVDYVNAFWLPSKQAMYYGDGMAGLMTNFVGCLDVVGHEMTHAVIDKLSPLEYLNQSGALNESIADVFGIMIKQKRDNQDALTSDWMLGKEIMDPSLNALGLRSMKNPGTAYDNPILGKDPQPDHMSRFVNTTDDQGGVHINSGIPNRAFYLFASKVGGNAWTNAGPVWFNALRLGQGGRLPYNAAFVDWARLTLEAAQDWKGPQLRQILKNCWTDVGVNVQ